MAKQEIKQFTGVTLFKTHNFNPKSIWGENYEVEINETKLIARVKNNEPFFREVDYSRWNKLNLVGQSISPTEVKTFYGLTVNGNRVYFSVIKPRTFLK